MNKSEVYYMYVCKEYDGCLRRRRKKIDYFLIKKAITAHTLLSIRMEKFDFFFALNLTGTK